MEILKTILKRFLKENVIESKQKLSDSAYRLCIKSEAIKSVDFVPGYFLRVGVGITDEGLSMKDFVRSYSVWNIDQTNGTIDLAIATQGNGPGANWAKQRKTGDTVYFRWKKGKFLIENSADSYLLIGDLSALAHLYMIRRNLTKEKQVESILYSQHKNELYADIDGSRPFDFYEMPQNPTGEIISKIKEIVPTMTGRKMVYIGGDSRVCVALNNYFRKELHWEANQIKTKPFWNPDKKGLE
ncbi:SIP domain-containing protein [Lunatibacter salilacus]|uniref:SIP domain-containing protein n=1 Tax=Lunatibacter salilacus TaxID=2483804 RepID=UPI00131B8404|nr:SIP domain-containing protein [Lunatibacter salilacus]